MMLRAASVGALGALIALLVSPGCGRRHAAVKPAAAPVRTPLPEWAPKNPSPEFLRALKLIKPLPPEAMSETPQAQAVALAARAAKIFPAAYDYFGTLSDQQIEQLKASKKLFIPVKSLNAKQRAALDRYFAAYREAMRGLSAQPGIPKSAEDLLVAMYEFGAKEDLSNVDAVFAIGGHSVNIQFRLRLPDGKDMEGFGMTLGTL